MSRLRQRAPEFDPVTGETSTNAPVADPVADSAPTEEPTRSKVKGSKKPVNWDQFFRDLRRKK